MSKVKVYTANAASFLGTRVENTITGMDVHASIMSSDVFADYLKTRQLKELVTVEIGQNTDVITRDLTRREELDLKLVKAEFKEAKAMAEDHLINQVFNSLRGKK